MSVRPDSLRWLPDLSPAQRTALKLVAAGERDDHAVRCATYDEARYLTGLVVKRQQGQALIDLGLARESRPNGRYLLITDIGREVVAWMETSR